ncbi:hypothetical protein CEF12_00415 [Enterococcus faecalis]|uniref:hypothetical protein n=1 Tax=Enterococcus faecalis TaxID=1351 RepID=UPI0001B1DF2B|nr:hypothetical protein [Enterococcus faecalis]EET98122.1 predicted protein [Enterococcus faecalis T2]EFM73330.1 hypothetical protein HMPREF9515_01528 [Enterococcus faecalis TX0860]EOJ21123.1 hypothetical protein UMS_00169 [Enterococcus faecalis EnGen0287]EOJ24947.1 hypothetical protein UMU_02922 [Enterococcus faecalis EnGen0300]EOK48714.1 hypothetical protein Q97_03122 [Enterococcus faecalis EnGen0061]
MQDSTIEFYPINLLGDIKHLDKKMMNLFSTVKNEYSNTRKEVYCMNVCQHCGAKQGEYFVYRDMNEFISHMTELEIERYI